MPRIENNTNNWITENKSRHQKISLKTQHRYITVVLFTDSLWCCSFIGGFFYRSDFIPSNSILVVSSQYSFTKRVAIQKLFVWIVKDLVSFHQIIALPSVNWILKILNLFVSFSKVHSETAETPLREEIAWWSIKTKTMIIEHRTPSLK